MAFSSGQISKSNLYGGFAIVVIGLLYAIVVGGREYTSGADTLAYANYFHNVHAFGFGEHRFEPLFRLATFMTTRITDDTSVYFAILATCHYVFWIAAIAFLAAMWGQGRGRTAKLTLVCIAFLLLSPFFVNSSINGIRQGLSVPFLVGSAVAFYNRRSWYAVGLALCAVGFHYSAAIYAPLIALVRLPLRSVVVITVVLAISYISGLSENVVSTMPVIAGVDLHSDVAFRNISASYRTGVRIDFAVFTLFWAAVALIGLRVRGVYGESVEQMLKVYMLLCVPFWVFGYGAYSNRLLLPAWLVLSLLLSCIIAGRRTRRLPSLVHGLIALGCLFVFAYMVDQGIVL